MANTKEEQENLDKYPEDMKPIMQFLQEAINLNFAKLTKEVQAKVDELTDIVHKQITRLDDKLQEIDKATFDHYCVIMALKSLLVGDKPGTIINEKKFESMCVDIGKLALDKHTKPEQKDKG